MLSFFENRTLERGSARSSRANGAAPANDEIPPILVERLGRAHAGQRLQTEREHEAQIFGHGLNFFHFENLTSSHLLIRTVLMLTGLYHRGLRNATRIQLRHNRIVSPRLPAAFHGFSILQLSDLHVDMNREAMEHMVSLVKPLQYDLCVLTGDFRGRTFGPFGDTLEQMAYITRALKGPLYGVLGNHDTIAMVPGLEEIGIQMLLNERDVIERGSEHIHLAGIDDAHFYQSDSIEKAAAGIPRDEFSILISHTPEVYKDAAHAGFDVMISGHTHGGQICLPGGIPITLDSKLPRHMGAGPWKYSHLSGYTSVGAGSSVVPVRFNCPPEITLHQLRGV